MTTDKIAMDTQEVSQVQWLTPLEMEELIEYQADACTPWLIEDWQLVREHLAVPER